MSPIQNTPIPSPRPILTATIWIAFAIFLTALDLHFVSIEISNDGFFASLQASQGVIDGLPHWRLYQSRILGPYMIHGIEHLFGLPSSLAYVAFIASCLLITKLIVIMFGLRHTDGVTSTLLMLISGSLLFAMLLSNPWLYPWDLCGLMLSTIFVVMVLRGVRWPWFLPLIAVTFLNRESGIFICVWLFVQGLLGYGKGVGQKPPNTGMMIAAAISALIGLAETEWLRSHLLVKEIGPELWHFTPAGNSWFHWKLGSNLAGFFSSLTSNSLYLPVIFYIFLLTGIAIAAVIGVRRYPTHTALCLAYSANMILILLFGVVNESRVMIEVIPFFSIFLTWLAAGSNFQKPLVKVQADEQI